MLKSDFRPLVVPFFCYNFSFVDLILFVCDKRTMLRGGIGGS